MDSRERFEKEFPPHIGVDYYEDSGYSAKYGHVGVEIEAIQQQARWEAWQACEKQQEEKYALVINSLRNRQGKSHFPQLALIAATIQMCADKCKTVKFDDSVGEPDWNAGCSECATTILSLTPADAQKALDELLREAVHAGYIATGEDEFDAIIERVKKETRNATGN